MGVQLNFYYPIINTQNGVTSTLKICLRSKKDSFDFILSHVSVCDPSIFVQTIGNEFFDIEFTRYIPEMIYSWPFENEIEYKVYENKENITPTYIHKILEPMIQNSQPIRGHFNTEIIESYLSKKVI